MAVSDSTDWLSTPLSSLAPVDSALRCQVCKDFFTTPMITSCSHTFCSLCIRRCLSQDGRCPACREQDQEMKLRRNWAVEELVGSFTQSRDSLLAFAEVAAAQGKEEEVDSHRPRKRRKLEGEPAPFPERRSTRSQSRRDAAHPSQQSDPSSPVKIVEDSEFGSEYEYHEEDQRSSPRLGSTSQPNDGLVACPMCGRRMKEQAVYAHLDTCTGAGSDALSPPPHAVHEDQSVSVAYAILDTSRQKERLPTINYALLSDNQLRKKLKELGIPTIGNKLLLQKRHTEWLNLWNANCDARKPRSKRDLLRELDTWERSQGRQIANNAGPSGVMVREFDRDNYVRANKDDFDDLIRKAREKKQTAKSVSMESDSSRMPHHETTSLQEIFAPEPGVNGISKDGEGGLDGLPETSDSLGSRHTNDLVDLTVTKGPMLESAQSQESRTNIAV